MVKYFERITIEGYFRSKKDAAEWTARKRAEGFEIAGPFDNGNFAFNHEFPWEAKASLTNEI